VGSATFDDSVARIGSETTVRGLLGGTCRELVELRHLLRGELHIRGCQVVLQLRHLVRSNQNRCHAFLAKQPGQSDLRR